MNKAALSVSVGLTLVGAALAILIGKEQMEKHSWLLNNQWLLPTLLLAAAITFFIALRDWPPFRRAVWAAMDAIIPRDRTRASAQPVELTEHLKIVATQLNKLSRFEQEAVRQIVLNGTMTGEEFAGQVERFGFPVTNLAIQNEVIATFDRIRQKTSVIQKDEQSEQWHIVESTRKDVALLLTASDRPIFS